MEKKGDGKKKEGNVDFIRKNSIAIVIVAIVLAAGAFYYLSNAPKADTPPAEKPIDSATAKLLMGTYDTFANLSVYYLNYTEEQDGMRIDYELRNNGTAKWAHVSGDMGEWVGYFYTNNSSQDIVCLLYKGQKACTSVGQNTTVKQISESIKGIFVTEAQNQAKKKQVQMLFEFGASKPKLTPTDDKVGVFNTTKASYTTDYKGLTVQQLNALGLSANDQNIYKIDDHTTTFWVDKKTGLTVKNRIEWVESGGDRYYQNAYSVVDLSPQIMPPLPENLTSVSGFAAFYNLIGQYSTELAACGAETDAVKKGMCYKKMAFERGDGELCTLIANQDERERCLLVVAQLTENATLCQNVVVIKDDCLIAVAGQNGDEALCAQVQNQSLSGICQEAVVAGKKKKADATAAQNGATPKNCVADSDCVIGGSFNQTCAPKTAQIAIGGNYSPFYSCVQNLPCACSEGYCGFATNENYTQCVGDIEDSIIEKLLNNTKENKTQTSNGSG